MGQRGNYLQIVHKNTKKKEIITLVEACVQASECNIKFLFLKTQE